MNNPPHFKGFLPIGLPEEKNAIVLNYEEYEAIRLSDFKLMGQVEASLMMGVSRPTFARIYESARRKVAEAFVLGRPIVFEGGKVYFDSEWYSCNDCGCSFNHAKKEEEVKHCALCGSSNVSQYNEMTEGNETSEICICPHCGFEKNHLLGIPCRNEICPECNSQLVRK
ncbi:MAG: DUF134 domain-containing protein [Bacteroidales bacterium]|nr:DUF134 domain-containing protein [Bacteroidales bacterium]